MSDDLTTLDGTLTAVWTMLANGVENATAPARTFALATQATTGGGAARMVVLRAADRTTQTIVIYTHRQSSKVRDIFAEPRVEALVWDPVRQFQIRLGGTIEITDGPRDIWEGFGPGTRQNYAVEPEPGRALAEPNEIDPVPDPSAFAHLTLRIDGIETLWLARDFARRARFTNGRAGWIAP